MNRTLVLISAISVGMITTTLMAQGTGAPATPSAPVAPRAIPAKIALIQLEQVAASTNEGKRSLQELEKKYAPKMAQAKALRDEIDALTKQLQAAPASMPAAERDSRAKTISVKQKQFERDSQDLQSSVGADEQAVIGKVTQKLGPIVINYVKKNGYTMLLDLTGQQGGAVNVLWTQDGTEISQAIIEAYNASSGAAAAAPSVSRPRPAPATGTAPKPATTPTK